MQNNISKHIGHDVEIVEREGAVSLRCKTCKQVVIRVERKYEGKSQREERVIRDIMGVSKALSYRFPNEVSMNKMVEDVMCSKKEGEEYYQYIYEKINRRVTNMSIEAHYFALAMGKVYNLPIVAGKQYGDSGYDEIYVDIAGKLVGMRGQYSYSVLEDYVRVERGKFRKMYNYLRDGGVSVLDVQLEETIKYIRENVEVCVQVNNEIESLEKHTDGKKETMQMRSGKLVEVKPGYKVVVLGWK